MTKANSLKFNENIFERQCREIYFALKQIGLEENEAWAEARLILEQVTGLKQAEQITSDTKDFPVKWLEEITRILNLRRERRPLAYCLGEIEFAGLSFRIIPGVLIPRVDTETLVEAVFEWAENIRNKEGSKKEGESTDNNAPSLNIAEIGIGSGIIAISLLKRLPNCTVWGCDISEAAIALTLGNARKHGVHERLTLVHGDWEKVLPNNFDVIVSNPPYIPAALSAENSPVAEPGKLDPWGKHKHKLSSEKQLQPEIYFEPKEALFAGEDGLDFYRQFAQILPKHFRQYKKENAENMQNYCDGKGPQLVAFEIGDEQSEAVSTIFQQQGWKNIEIKKDINNLPRVLTVTPPKS